MIASPATSQESPSPVARAIHFAAPFAFAIIILPRAVWHIWRTAEWVEVGSPTTSGHLAALLAMSANVRSDRFAFIGALLALTCLGFRASRKRALGLIASGGVLFIGLASGYYSGVFLLGSCAALASMGSRRLFHQDPVVWCVAAGLFALEMDALGVRLVMDDRALRWPLSWMAEWSLTAMTPWLGRLGWIGAIACIASSLARSDRRLRALFVMGSLMLALGSQVAWETALSYDWSRTNSARRAPEDGVLVSRALTAQDCRILAAQSVIRYPLSQRVDVVFSEWSILDASIGAIHAWNSTPGNLAIVVNGVRSVARFGAAYPRFVFGQSLWIPSVQAIGGRRASSTVTIDFAVPSRNRNARAMAP